MASGDQHPSQLAMNSLGLVIFEFQEPASTERAPLLPPEAGWPWRQLGTLEAFCRTHIRRCISHMSYSLVVPHRSASSVSTLLIIPPKIVLLEPFTYLTRPAIRTCQTSMTALRISTRSPRGRHYGRGMNCAMSRVISNSVKGEEIQPLVLTACLCKRMIGGAEPSAEITCPASLRVASPHQPAFDKQSLSFLIMTSQLFVALFCEINQSDQSAHPFHNGQMPLVNMPMRLC